MLLTKLTAGVTVYVRPANLFNASIPMLLQFSERQASTLRMIGKISGFSAVMQGTGPCLQAIKHSSDHVQAPGCLSTCSGTDAETTAECYSRNARLRLHRGFLGCYGILHQHATSIRLYVTALRVFCRHGCCAVHCLPCTQPAPRYSRTSKLPFLH